MYKAIKYFTDLQDKNHPYNVGDVFPRSGIAVTEKRLAELAGSDNKQKEPLIELVEESAETAEISGTAAGEEPAEAKKESPKKSTRTRKAPAKVSSVKAENADE